MKQLRLPQDSLGFVRRECSHCRRQFKTRPFPSDGISVQRFFDTQLPHENPHELVRTSARLVCLYCGKPAPPEAWLTGEQRSFLERIAEETARDLRHAQLAYIEQTLSLNPRPTFVTVTPEHGYGAMLPEPDDLQIIPLLCCGEEAKGSELAGRQVFCPRCGARQEGRPLTRAQR